MNKLYVPMINKINSWKEYERNRPFSEEIKDTLREPITNTIKRDLKLIYTKMKYVLNPFVKESDRAKQVKQWDLWGPLIFTLLLAITSLAASRIVFVER